jgi:hypothetical protein
MKARALVMFVAGLLLVACKSSGDLHFTNAYIFTK